LVTPYSQYVKNVAIVNVLNQIKGKERWSLIDDNTWDMLLGKSGKLPGELGVEIKKLSKDFDNVPLIISISSEIPSSAAIPLPDGPYSPTE
jgi:pyruvate/oxaloacetate carboxyltransferase